MLEEYKGIKIEDKIIIVEKQNDEHQGYLVNLKNKAQLDTALNWAKHSSLIKDEEGNTIVDHYYYFDPETRKQIIFNDLTDEIKNLKCSYYSVYKRETLEGIVHEYENGKFKLSLKYSASGSSQGGKLSFWNCSILAPDGKEFLIGINSNCLIELLKNNTFVNGVCQGDIWLGRINANVGAFTSNMEEFSQAKKDNNIRTSPKRSSYEIGSILLPFYDVYLGKIYQQFSIFRTSDYGLTHKYAINVYSNPKAFYVYKSMDAKSLNKENVIEEIFSQPIFPCYCDFLKNKKPSVVSSSKIEFDQLESLNRSYEKIKTGNFRGFSSCGISLKSDSSKTLSFAEQYKRQFTLDSNSNKDEILKFFEDYSIEVYVDQEDELINKGFLTSWYVR